MLISNILFVVSLMTVCGVATGTVEASENTEETIARIDDSKLAEARLTLASDWFNYLQTEENRLCDMLWALDYAEIAVNTCDWGDMQRALAAVETASLDIEARTLPEQEMTEEEYTLLSSEYGEDVYVVQMEYGSESDLHNSMKILRGDIAYRIFSNEDLDDIKEEIEYQKKGCEAYLKYYATETAYLMKVIPDCEEMRKLKNYIQDYLPLISEKMPEDNLDMQLLEDMGSVVLDDLEEYINGINELSIIRENDITMLEEAVISGDDSLLKKDSTTVKGADVYLPAPAWYSDDRAEITWLFYDGEGEKSSIPDIRQELSGKVPSELSIICDDVLEEEFLLFVSRLKERELVDRFAEKEESMTYYIADDDWSMITKWERGCVDMVVIGDIPCFVPFWHETVQK